MQIGIFLGHPAHFYIFKNVIPELLKSGNQVHIVIKKKDILEEIVKQSGYEYTTIREDRSDSRLGLIKSVVQMEWGMIRFIRKNKIDILIGSTLSFAARCICGIPVVAIGEDDANVVPKYANMVYPFANQVLTPVVCDNGKWNKKSIKYSGYHELAYLHPNHFTPQRKIVEQYFSTERPYFLIRFAKLNAHHDLGIQGINAEIAKRIIDYLLPYGDIYITSERELEPQFEPYRIKINPLDMHHVMAFAQLYIGDSQTMAAEAGVLGVPFIRFNDFVGRIGYLRELEDEYQLGFGIKTFEVERLYSVIQNIIEMTDRKEVFERRRTRMLSEKIDYARFLFWFIDNYPRSVRVIKDTPDYQNRFMRE